MSFSFTNFSRATLAGLHDATTTTFNLAGVQGTRFPTGGEFRAVVWNFTDYPDPVDARYASPRAAEIVQVTQPIFASQFTQVARNIEGIGAVAFDNPDKEYRIMCVATAGYYNGMINPDKDSTHWSGTLNGSAVWDANGAQMRLANGTNASGNMLVSLQGGTSASLVGVRMSDNAGAGLAGVTNNLTTGDMTLTAFTRLIVNSDWSRFDGRLGLGSGASLTVSAGAITVTHSFHQIDSTGGADDLDTITGGNTGDLLILRITNGANPITVRNSVDNIITAGNRVMDNTSDLILLFKQGANWYELSWNNNA